MADLSALVGMGAHVAKAVGLGYAPVNSIVLWLQAVEHLFMLLPTGIALDVM